jgi:predicted RNA binding protein YcfA (HicA-like mRNA interferase family)
VTGLSVCSGAAAVRALERAGFKRVSQRSSHVKLRHPTTRRTAIVPLHRELAVGTLRSVLRQADLTVEEFRALLKRR